MRNYLLTGIFIVSVAQCQNVFAYVDSDSIFQEARYPASHLDLELSIVQKNWWQQFVAHPSNETVEKYPLVVKTGAVLQLDYFGDDKITASAWITKLDGFLALSQSDRMALLSEIMKAINDYLFLNVSLVNKDTGQRTGKIIKNRHVVLSVIINEITKNTKGESIRQFLPMDIGVGQAGYKNGQFVYSLPYFINLEIKNGEAVAGDGGEFVINNE